MKKIKIGTTRKAFLLVYAMILLMIWIFLRTEAQATQDVCVDHQIIEESINESSCSQNGTINRRCEQCGEITEVIKLAKYPHTLGEYTITTPPSKDMDGIQEAVCTTCGYVDAIPYFCPHVKLFEMKTKDPTCEEVGTLECICADCTTVVHVLDIPALGHSYGDWSIAQYAEPHVDGLKEKTCEVCTKVVQESYEFSIGENAIYAPGTNLNADIVYTAMTQSAVDSYDLIYNTYYWGCDGPWILGHSTRSMRFLPDVQVGQNIYVSVNGEMTTYKVIISEFAMQNSSWTDIVGQTCGHSVFKPMEGEHLRMYTCYGGYNGRWIVIAEKVG